MPDDILRQAAQALANDMLRAALHRALSPPDAMKDKP